MSLSLRDIEQEVSQLTSDERAKLIGFLIATLEPADEGDVEAAWAQEIAARSREIQDGTVIPVPADEALARVRGNLR